MDTWKTPPYLLLGIDPGASPDHSVAGVLVVDDPSSAQEVTTERARVAVLESYKAVVIRPEELQGAARYKWVATSDLSLRTGHRQLKRVNAEAEADAVYLNTGVVSVEELLGPGPNCRCIATFGSRWRNWKRRKAIRQNRRKLKRVRGWV